MTIRFPHDDRPKARQPHVLTEMAVWPGPRTRCAPAIFIADTPGNYQVWVVWPDNDNPIDYRIEHNRVIFFEPGDTTGHQLDLPGPVRGSLASSEQSGEHLIVTLPKAGGLAALIA